MKIKELIKRLETLNPEALVLLRDSKDLTEAYINNVDPQPSSKETNIVMLWGNFR